MPQIILSATGLSARSRGSSTVWTVFLPRPVARVHRNNAGASSMASNYQTRENPDEPSYRCPPSLMACPLGQRFKQELLGGDPCSHAVTSSYQRLPRPPFSVSGSARRTRPPP